MLSKIDFLLIDYFWIKMHNGRQPSPVAWILQPVGEQQTQCFLMLRAKSKGSFGIDTHVFVVCIY